jgi:hypothetical protein
MTTSPPPHIPEPRDGAGLEPGSSVDGSIGQPYDSVMRRWVQQNLATVIGWLDPAAAGLARSAYAPQAATFALPTITADHLTLVGRNRLVHIEYETSPRKSLVPRLLNYRARIMTLYPKHRLTQHVIVLGDGRVRGHDDESNGFTLTLHVVYLRERDAQDYLANPVLAPLAVLTKGPRARRERAFAAALRLIRDSRLPGTAELIQAAETLAHIRLDRPTIDRIRKENAMSIQPLVDHYRDTEVGQLLQQIGQLEEKKNLLRELLLANFGESADIAAVVERLSGWSDRQAMQAILAARSIQDLLTSEPPS